MVIEFEFGKIIVTPHEVVVRLSAPHSASLHAHPDALTLIGKGANVLLANASDTKWSIKLSEQQLQTLSDELCIPFE